MSHSSVPVVLALVWTLLMVQCSSCPLTMCRCKNFATDLAQTDFYTVATCTELPTTRNATITRTDQLIFDKLREITLVGLNTTLNFEEFNDHLFNSFPNLKRFSLKNSTVTLLTHPDNFTLPPLITYLDLSGNNLDSWWLELQPDNNIQVLDISDNRLNSLRNHSFRTLPTMEVLNISYNNVSVIEQDTFFALVNLKCLDLSGNAIISLPNRVFQPIASLQYLNLSFNALKTFDENYISRLGKLQHLDLSWNDLQKVTLENLELPNLARLLLAGNQNLGAPKNAHLLVSSGRKLQLVDASHIGLQQVPPSLTISIRTLKLTGNMIKNINCGDLDSYPLLQMLDFISNDIDFIEEDSLGRLDSLMMLSLTDNKIKELPKSLPEKLQVLRLESNLLDRIAEGDLQGLTKLEVLLLNDNKIRIIEAKAFSHLPSLVNLDLSNNPVSVLQPGCLLGPTSLQVLRLSGIELISPAKDVTFPLSAPEHLITLDLSNSPGLTRQFMADTAVLAASKQLQELDLSNANLDVIRSDLMHYLPQLRSLHLDGNKLNCTRLQWLASWIRKQDEREYRRIVCASPPELWGTLLIDLTYEETEIPETVATFKAETQPVMSTDFLMEASTEFIMSTELHDGSQNGKFNDMISTLLPTLRSESKVPLRRKLTTTSAKPPLQADNDDNENNIANPNLLTKIISKTTYTKVDLSNLVPTTATTNAKLNPGIKAQSFYTKVLDSPVYHRNENVYREKSTTLFVDIVPRIRNWNGTADELSAHEKKKDEISLHPGMIISFIGLLGAIAVIVMFASKFTNRKPSTVGDDVREIEVSSLPSVTELW